MKVPLTVLVTSALLFIVAFSITVKGQKANAIENFRQVYIGLNFSPDYNFRTLENNSGSSSAGLVLKRRNDLEIAKFGYTTGLTILITCSKHFGLETGIQYSNKGYKTKGQDLVFETPDPNAPTNSKSIYSYYYVGIPLKAMFTNGKSKVRFLSSVGFMANYLLKVTAAHTLAYPAGRNEEKKQSITSDFKKVDLSPMISVGINYKINDRFYFIAEPTFRYGVINTKDAALSEHLWNAGINLGIYKRLK